MTSWVSSLRVWFIIWHFRCTKHQYRDLYYFIGYMFYDFATKTHARAHLHMVSCSLFTFICYQRCSKRSAKRNSGAVHMWYCCCSIDEQYSFQCDGWTGSIFHLLLNSVFRTAERKPIFSLQNWIFLANTLTYGPIIIISKMIHERSLLNMQRDLMRQRCSVGLLFF